MLRRVFGAFLGLVLSAREFYNALPKDVCRAPATCAVATEEVGR